MSGFVVDCSLAVTWLFTEEATPESDGVLSRLASEAAVVPGWWYLELTNVIALAERRGRVTVAKSEAFLQALRRIEIEVDEEGAAQAVTRVLPLCRATGLTGYDAVYLELALRRKLPLATLDAALREAARRLGVEVLI